MYVGSMEVILIHRAAHRTYRLCKPVHRTTLQTTTFSPLKPNDPYRGRTAALTSKRDILYIY